MNKYIDAERLKAEIERRIAAYQKNFDKADNKIAKLSTDGRIASLKGILPFIISLTQEQPVVVDEDFFFDEVLKVYDDNDKYPPRSEEELAMLEIIAHHFYDLGLKARKE